MVTPDPGEFLRPFRSRWLTISGDRYHYLDEGPADAPALVVVHGNPTWSFCFRHLVSAFNHRYRIVVPDHMGCGLSDRPAGYLYTLESHVNNLEALISDLKLTNVALLMHDWGGAIGMGYATRHPGNVSRLVVFNSAAFYSSKCPLRIRVCRIPALGTLLVRGLNAFSRGALRYATSRPDRFTDRVRAGYLAPYPDWGSRVAVHAFVKDIPLEAHHPTRHTLDEIDRRLPALSSKPTLIVWGADDFCFTEKDFLPQWRRRFPGAEVHVLENAGHYVVEDAHDRIAPLLVDFLSRPEPEAA